jgi:hypothetical protein
MNKPIREGFVAEEPAPAEAAPPVPEQRVENWPIKVKLLHHPIRNHKNEELHELSFREPTAADIIRNGNPCRIDSDWEIIIDDRKMSAMLATLGGILTPEIERLDPRDFASCSFRLRGFFLPEPAAWG